MKTEKTASKSLEVFAICGLLLVLIAALFAILSKGYDDTVQKWAFGAVGTVVGVMVTLLTIRRQ